MTKPPPTDIDQQELEAAINSLTDGTADDGQEVTIYRSPLEVAREEWRKRIDKLIHPDISPEAKANFLSARTMNGPFPLPQADVVDMEVFEQLLKS